MSPAPRIVEYDPRWPEEFAAVASSLRSGLGGVAVAVEHIGSTAIAGLPAKDIIDVMALVSRAEDLDVAADRLAAAGWAVRPPGLNDHPVPGLSGDSGEWVKRFANPPDGMRPVNLHVRVAGRANARYALLFRDYLRVHGLAAVCYAEAKRRLAPLCASTAEYADAKDPICDLIYLAAQQWAEAAGWQPSWTPR